MQFGTHAHRRFADRLAGLGLHPRHFGMLSHLAAAEGQSQQALSLAWASTAAPWSRSSTTSSGAGSPSAAATPPTDARTRSILTAAGRELLAELERAADDEDAGLLTALDASERSQLISLLQRVAESQGLAAGVHPNLEPRD